MTASSHEPDPIQPQQVSQPATQATQATQVTRAAREVAATAKEQGASVTQEVRDQVRRLGGQTRTRLGEQASSERDRAVDGLRAMSRDLQGMAEQTDGSGVATQLAMRGADYTRQAADYLAGREPGELVDEIRRFARRRPGLFLLGATAAGVVVGRLSRGAVQAARESEDDRHQTGQQRSAQPAAPSADDLATSSMGTATTADPTYGADDVSVVAGPSR